MSKVFTNKTSYSLLKTNPKITGNIKMVVDSKGDIFIETIDAGPELTRNKYKRVKLDIQNNWTSAIYNFFNSGSIPESLLYGIKDNEDFYSIKTDYSKQYYTNYQQGATPKISKLYNEQISYFAPLWLEPKDVPEHFAIFKIPNPVSISTKNETSPFSQDIESKIYNTNYFKDEEDSNYFYETILSKAKLHKIFDLGEGTKLGDYLRKHINDENLPESSLTIDWNINKQSTVNGISVRKSGFTKESFNLFSEAFPVDRTVTEFDNLITNQFQLNGVIHSNIINIEFLFDDEEDEDFTINRYFGVYFNRNDISKFKLDSKAFYDKKYDNLPQNKNIKSINDVDILSDSNILLENESGVKLFVDYENEYNLKSSDIKGGDFLPYIYSTDGLFYDINNNSDWKPNELVLKDTLVNTKDLKGFTKDSLGIIPALKTNKPGRSYFEFTINGTLNSFELRIKSVDETDTNFDINQVFVGDSELESGTYINNKFSLSGNPDEIANSIVTAINNYSNSNEDFNIYAIAKFNRVVVFTRGSNEYWNNYKFLIYSKDTNVDNVIEVPYRTFESIIDFNRNFLDYNSIILGEESTFENEDFKILESNFTGGNNFNENKIRVPIEFKQFFNSNLFLKTQNWYSKIVSVDAYLDEPKFQNGRIVNFDDIDNYITINCNDDIFITKGSYCEIYDVETNKVGLMSMYPIKQFDIDQFRSDYGKDGDGYINKLEENYNKQVDSTDKSHISVENNISNFKDSGFKRLGGRLNENTGEIESITNEYDRLLENQLPQLAIKGRIIPFINKWVYDDEGKDVRENNYRLSSNSAFSYDNFSPSSINKTPDFRFFTHEWYYLQEYPYYLTTEEKINSFSYFDSYIDIEKLKENNENYFEKYFTQYEVDGISFPTKRKYSIVSGGNDDSFGETFFRGTKIKFKRRVETIKKLNFNIQNIGVYRSDEFNDYKFSAILTNKTENAIKFSVIENQKYKNITMVIEANIDDFYLNKGATANGATGLPLFLDRSSLYVLENKYDEEGEVADIDLTGAISPFIEDENGNFIPNFTLSDGVYTINGIENSETSSLPSFNNQIIPNNEGSYNDIEIIFNNENNIKLVISDILSTTKNTITANSFIYKRGTQDVNIPQTYNNLIPRPEDCIDKVPKYINGGFNAYKNTLEEISFANIFDKINNGSPDIKYITINEDESVINNTFVMEFENYSINTKADYITTEPIIFNGVKNSDFSPIGVKTTGLQNTYFSTMYRFNGNYNPKVKDVILFKDSFDNKFSSEIREKIRFTNTQFFSTYPNFALYKQLYLSKINEQNPLTILDLNKDSALRPEFWKLGEISLDKRDAYLFRSCWDHNYHRRYDSKIKFISYPGYIEPKEISSFLASTIMNIPNSIKLDIYNNNNIIVDTNTSNQLSGQILNTNQLIDNLSPRLQELFEKYVNNNFNFQKLDTLDDDIERYIKTNILTRYFSENIYAYIKYSSKVSNEPLIETNKTEQELITDGFIKLNNINFIQQRFSEFDYKFTFNKPSDKNITLAFITNIITV